MVKVVGLRVYSEVFGFWFHQIFLTWPSAGLGGSFLTMGNSLL